jgi:antitoxin component YwqK of YwqJK toxin-antitoxin module
MFLHKNLTVLPGMLVIIFFLSIGFQSCGGKADVKTGNKGDKKQEVVVKKRADGTISSISQVDEFNKVHGQRLEYYADGKTLYSKVIYKRGVRHGPAIWYYSNGKASLHLNYLNGKKEGPSRNYYKSGKLKSETTYADDHPLPGLKEYDMEGNLVTGYSDVSIRENYQLGNGSTVVIELTCSRKSDKVKFYYLEEENGVKSRIYLISKNGSAVKRFYLNEGEVINKDIYFLVEIPTDLGNTLVKELSYHLDARRL